MQPAEFYEVVEYINERWAYVGPWKPDTAGRLATDFRHLPGDIVKTALHRIYEEGHTQAPSPSKLLAKATADFRQHRLQNPPELGACRPGNHRWAILAELEGDLREVHCVICRTEETRPRASVPTALEEDEGLMDARTVHKAPPGDSWAERKDLQ